LLLAACPSPQALAGSTAPHANRKRVVAGCFQELLFLASHGLVSLTQERPYRDVAVHKTARFDQTRVDETA
jgi:chromatin segregation and condensation protein Rec8/ScpA/Scc1 (kleisin family)